MDENKSKRSVNRKRVYLAFSSLHLVLRDLQSDLGLTRLSVTELDIISIAIKLTSERKQSIASVEIVDRALLLNSSRATVYRAISSLEKSGFLVPDKIGAKSSYTLNLDV